MALETLKGIKEIGGYKVSTTEEANACFKRMTTPSGESQNLFRDEEWDEWRSKHPIMIDHERNSIAFKIQKCPVKEVGVNGCQVDTLIEAAMIIVAGLNVKYPCEENNEAIVYLQKAMKALTRRKLDREQRGVEGTNQP